MEGELIMQRKRKNSSFWMINEFASTFLLGIVGVMIIIIGIIATAFLLGHYPNLLCGLVFLATIVLAGFVLRYILALIRGDD